MSDQYSLIGTWSKSGVTYVMEKKMKIVNTGSYRKLNLILEEFIALLKSAEDTSQSPTTKSIHAHVWSSLLT